MAFDSSRTFLSAVSLFSFISMGGHSFVALSQLEQLSRGLDFPVVFSRFSFPDLLFPLSSGEGKKKDDAETKKHSDFQETTCRVYDRHE